MKFASRGIKGSVLLSGKCFKEIIPPLFNSYSFAPWMNIKLDFNHFLCRRFVVYFMGRRNKRRIKFLPVKEISEQRTAGTANIRLNPFERKSVSMKKSYANKV